MEQLCNDPSTTLGLTIDGLSTTVIVAVAAGFPTSGNFRIRIDNELLLVTAVSGTTWTVTRGIENTTPAPHQVGAPVNAYLTSGGLAQYVSDTISAFAAFGSYSNLPSGTAVGQIYKCTDVPYTFYYNGIAWVPLYRDTFPAVLPPTSGWSWNNQNSASVLSTTAEIVFSLPSYTYSSNDRIYYRTPAYTVGASSGYSLVIGMTAYAYSSNYNDYGILALAGLTSKSGAYSQNLAIVGQINGSSTSYATNVFGYGFPVKMKFTDDGSSLQKVYVSLTATNTNWIQLASGARATGITNVAVMLDKLNQTGTLNDIVELWSWEEYNSVV